VVKYAPEREGGEGEGEVFDGLVEVFAEFERGERGREKVD
jgi:hypothetical protein